MAVHAIEPPNGTEHIVSLVEGRLEAKILAAIGKWATRIILTVIGCTFAGAGAWFGAINRIEKLETWKAERTKPIEEFYTWQRDLEGEIATIKAQNQQNKELIQELRTLLKAR